MDWEPWASSSTRNIWPISSSLLSGNTEHSFRLLFLFTVFFGQSFINLFTVLLRYDCVLGISAFFALCSVFCCSLFCFLFFYIQFFSVLMFYFLCNYSKFFCFLCIVHFLCSIELSYCSPIFYSMLCVLLCYGTLFYILLFYMILLYSSLFYIM